MSAADIVFEDTRPDAGTDCSSTLYDSSETHDSVDSNDVKATSTYLDDEERPRRTSHAEAFDTVDSSYLKRMRQRPEPQRPLSGLLGTMRRKLLGQGSRSQSQVTAISPGACDPQYRPPWLTLISRTEQEKREERERVARAQTQSSQR